MAGMMNFNPAGYSIPLQQQSPFAPGREATPQQAHPYPQQQQQQFYSNQQVAATYSQPQFSPPAHYPQQSFGGGTVPVHANGAAAYGGGINVQPGFQNQYPGTYLLKNRSILRFDLDPDCHLASSVLTTNLLELPIRTPSYLSRRGNTNHIRTISSCHYIRCHGGPVTAIANEPSRSSTTTTTTTATAAAATASAATDESDQSSSAAAASDGWPALTVSHIGRSRKIAGVDSTRNQLGPTPRSCVSSIPRQSRHTGATTWSHLPHSRHTHRSCRTLPHNLNPDHRDPYRVRRKARPEDAEQRIH
jgi:hypothetical protein